VAPGPGAIYNWSHPPLLGSVTYRGRAVNAGDGDHLLQAVPDGGRPRRLDGSAPAVRALHLGAVGGVADRRPCRGQVPQLPRGDRLTGLPLPGRSIRLPAPDA